MQLALRVCGMKTGPGVTAPVKTGPRGELHPGTALAEIELPNSDGAPSAVFVFLDGPDEAVRRIEQLELIPFLTDWMVLRWWDPQGTPEGTTLDHKSTFADVSATIFQQNGDEYVPLFDANQTEETDDGEA